MTSQQLMSLVLSDAAAGHNADVMRSEVPAEPGAVVRADISHSTKMPKRYERQRGIEESVTLSGTARVAAPVPIDVDQGWRARRN
jgi:hypothetical protein